MSGGGGSKQCIGTNGCRNDAAHLTMHQFAWSDTQLRQQERYLENSKSMSSELLRNTSISYYLTCAGHVKCICQIKYPSSIHLSRWVLHRRNHSYTPFLSYKYFPFWNRLPKSAALANISLFWPCPSRPPSAISFSRSNPRLLGSSSSSCFSFDLSLCVSYKLFPRFRSLYSRIRRSVSASSLSPLLSFLRAVDDEDVDASTRPSTSSSSRRRFSSGVSVHMALTPLSAGPVLPPPREDANLRALICVGSARRDASAEGGTSIHSARRCLGASEEAVERELDCCCCCWRSCFSAWEPAAGGRGGAYSSSESEDSGASGGLEGMVASGAGGSEGPKILFLGEGFEGLDWGVSSFPSELSPMSSSSGFLDGGVEPKSRIGGGEGSLVGLLG